LFNQILTLESPHPLSNKKDINYSPRSNEFKKHDNLTSRKTLIKKISRGIKLCTERTK